MSDGDSPIDALKIIEDPTLIDRTENLYMIVGSNQAFQGTYTNLVKAINILAMRGWETLSVSADRGFVFALCRSPHFKRKNMGVSE
jgi:hypothetical protein